MVGLVIASHGTLADGLKNAVNLIAGPQENVETVSFKECESIESLKDDLDQAVRLVDKSKGVIIFTDLFGASPANAAATFMKEDVVVITGANLPMILEILILRKSLNINDLVEKCVRSGKDSIINQNEMLLEALRNEMDK